METQLNSMQQKANVLKTLGQLLEDSLVAIAMVISLPPTYSTLQTILMATDDKLTMDAVINQVLIEEKSRKVSSTHSALAVKTTGRSKQKCSKSGHTEDECWAKKAAECSKEKDDRRSVYSWHDRPAPLLKGTGPSTPLHPHTLRAVNATHSTHIAHRGLPTSLAPAMAKPSPHQMRETL
ncbi:hypothetical protein SCLCIDRAFT_838418 [Scleroderma citrinum Foug A]|uniref:Uncharacterized protein n=1 Tax=Scleroderma citrinum Foug A TaxID=1036808 RepID=A0A0C2ZKV7_9AGAM|nr:hypothetical protein SCLCIDRAFT_838418 [Scleroderma citrinum Foug A]